MTGIAVLAFTVVSVYVFTMLDPVEEPHIDVDGWGDGYSEEIHIRHSGGEILNTDDLELIINVNETKKTYTSSEIKDKFYNKNTWGLSDTLSVNISKEFGQEISDETYLEFTLIHTKSRIIIENDILDTATFNVGNIEDESSDNKDNFQKIAFPCAYDDGPLSTSTYEKESIPPYNAMGKIIDFENLQDNDSIVSRIIEVPQAGVSGNKQQSRVGLEFCNVSSGTHEIIIEYRTSQTFGESFYIKVVDSTGAEIDNNMDYLLSQEPIIYKKVAIQLSTTESNWVDNNNKVYIIIEDGLQGGNDKEKSSVYIDFINVSTSTP